MDVYPDTLPRASPLVAFLLHKASSKDTLRFQLIVRAATQTQPLHRGASTARHRIHMIEFQETALPATMPRGADERAPTSVALPYGAANAR